MKLSHFILGLFVFLHYANYGQTLQENFTELVVHEGKLKGTINHRIKAIEQDSNGFLWYGTNHGLYRYDGYEFRLFKNNEDQNNSLPSNQINAIQAAKDGVLWVATNRGVCKYNPDTEDFTRYLHGDSTGGYAIILDLTLDNRGVIWMLSGESVYTSKNGNAPVKIDAPDSLFAPRSIDAFKDRVVVGGPSGFYVFSISSKKWSKIAIPDEVFLDNPKLVSEILIWSDSLLYFGTYNGLFSLNLLDTTYQSIKIHTDEKFVEQSKLIGKFGPLVLDLERSNNKLWVAYRFLGVAELNTQTHTWKTFVHDLGAPNSLLSNRAYSLFKDPYHNIWIGTIKGVQRYHNNEEVKTYVVAPGYLNIENYIPNMFEDSQKRCWISSVQGLYLSPKFGEKAVKFPVGGDSKHTLRNKDAHVLAEDLNGTIWIGGNKIGLHKYANNTLERVSVSPNFDRIHSFEIKADKENANILWMATLQGFFKFNTQTHQIDTLAKIHKVFRLPQFSFLLDNDTLTGFTNSGVYQYDLKTGEVNVFTSDIFPKYSRIDQFVKEKNGTIWAATTEGLLVLKNGKVSYGLPKSNLQKERVHTVLFFHNLIWFSTHNKMYSLNPSSNEIKTYLLPENSHQAFGRQSGAILAGNICFGGSDGISVITPNHLLSYLAPKTRITKILIGDSIISNENLLLELESANNAISFQYSSMNFDPSYQPNYRYRMKGLDENWKLAGPKHEVVYPHLPDGSFVFEVQSKMLNGDWGSKSATFDFTILPPFYKTIGFKAVIGFLAALLIWIYFRINAQQKLLKQEKLLAEQKAAYKSKFLANMSHEIRTPLNAIMGLNNLLKKSALNEKQYQWAEGIESSSSGLMRIVNDILDQEKIESGKYTFVKQSFSLRKIITQSANNFKLKADIKGIKINVQISDSLPSKLMGDPVRIRQVINNLVANAVKFTDKGEVNINASVLKKEGDANQVLLVVKDTGIGIPPEKQGVIFESFEQARETDRTIDAGAGLGLSISKQLVEQMNGTILLTSEKGKGAEFSVVLWLNEVIEKTVSNTEKTHKARGYSNLQVLLVEDLALNRMLATELLNNNFENVHIDIAENGLEAVKKISKNKYDIVLMDIKMPVMDGYEATELLRKEFTKEQLPILALTANAIDDQIKKCQEVGMNDCITKPILEQDLVEKINRYALHGNEHR